MKKVRLGAPERLWYSSWRKAGFFYPSPISQDDVNFFYSSKKKPAGVKVRIKLRLEIEDFTGAGLAWFLTRAGYVYPSPISHDDVNFFL